MSKMTFAVILDTLQAVIVTLVDAWRHFQLRWRVVPTDARDDLTNKREGLSQETVINNVWELRYPPGSVPKASLTGYPFVPVKNQPDFKTEVVKLPRRRSTNDIFVRGSR